MSDFIDTRWRPIGGWVCVLTLAYAGFGHSLLSWLFAFYAVMHQATVPELKEVSESILFQIIGVMLVLGGYRTYEKTKGVSGNTPVSTESSTSTVTSTSVKVP